MDLSEAERRLRQYSPLIMTDQLDCAYAIRDHLAVCGNHDGCVSAEKARKLASTWRGYAEGDRDMVRRATFIRTAIDLESLLPPEPSYLDQAIAMVEEREQTLSPSFYRDILNALRRAKEDAK